MTALFSARLLEYKAFTQDDVSKLIKVIRNRLLEQRGGNGVWMKKDPISWFPRCSGNHLLVREALFPGHFAFLVFVLLSGFFGT